MKWKILESGLRPGLLAPVITTKVLVNIPKTSRVINFYDYEKYSEYYLNLPESIFLFEFSSQNCSFFQCSFCFAYKNKYFHACLPNIGNRSCVCTGNSHRKMLIQAHERSIEENISFFTQNFYSSCFTGDLYSDYFWVFFEQIEKTVAPESWNNANDFLTFWSDQSRLNKSFCIFDYYDNHCAKTFDLDNFRLNEHNSFVSLLKI